MNGMPYNNMNNTGGGYNTTLVINMGTVQEMTITTSGLSAESADERRDEQHHPERRRQHVIAATSSATTRATACRPTTSRRISRTAVCWRSATPIASGISIRRSADRSSRTRVWFYGGYRYSGTRSYVAGGFKNKNPTGNQYCNIVAGCTFDGVLRAGQPRSRMSRRSPAIPSTRGETLNLTLAVAAAQQGDDLRPLQPAAGGLQRLQRHHVAGSLDLLHASARVSAPGTWTNPYTNKLLFEGGFTFYNERWIFGPQPNEHQRLRSRTRSSRRARARTASATDRASRSRPPATISTT